MRLKLAIAAFLFLCGTIVSLNAQVGPIPGMGPLPFPPCLQQLSYVGGNSISSAATTITFTSQAIGTAASSRLVVVAINWLAGATGRSLTGVTFGGSSANSVVTAINGTLGGDSLVEALYSLPVPTGTTSTIVLTFSTGGSGANIDVFSLYNLNSQTAFNTASTSSASAAALTVTPQVPVCGILVANATFSNASTFSWTGANLNSNLTAAGFLQNSSASISNLSAQTARTITATNSGSAALIALAAATWN